MTTKSKKLNSDQFPKDLNPRHADTKYLGSEPLFLIQPDSDRRAAAMSWSFHWYNQFYDKKAAKDMLAEYLDANGLSAQAKLIRRVQDSEILSTFCWLSRMNRRGLELTPEEQTRLSTEVSRLLHTLAKPEDISATIEEKVTNRPNIQEIMRERAREAAGELEAMFDEFMLEAAKPTTKFKPIDEVAKKNVMPQHINIIADKWKRKLQEFESISDDRELQQAYSNLSKTELKNIIKFIEQVLNDLNGYVSIKKTTAKPRARKAVPVEKIVAKLKYLREFEDKPNKLSLVSVHPTKLHGASEAWVYDTAKRKLHHYIADEYSKSFTVKGNTVLGFDKVTSEIKTLRKPGEQIKEVMGSKPAARKYFKDIKAVATTPNGRFNEHMIILKAW
jgi:hypothetical protein